ncbi:MAG: NAD(P)/FAD-dependent oxidoreductase [Syntrophobacteraceae bacterium]
MRYVIIGNGVAGIHAAEAIRHLDADGPITMISDECFPPYCRPMISLVLEGAAARESLPVRSERFYETLKIEALLGERVIGLDTRERTVSLPNGRVAPYDRLLIASGSDPRSVKAAGSELSGIFPMRTEAHVRAMLETLPGVKRALVLGGGLVGFKAAYGLLHRNIPVTMLIGSGYPLSMQVDEAAGRMIHDELVQKGLTVRVGLEVTGFDGNGRVQRAHLSDGTELACDLVVVGKGVLPSRSFVPRDQVQVDLGILVDDHLETSAPGVFAAGDVAESLDIARKTRWINAIWPEAVAQGRIAGMNMAGRQVSYRGSLGRNVIRIFDLDVLTAGLVNPPASDGFEVLSRFHKRSGRYRKLVFGDGKLVGAVLVNGIEQGGLLVSLIQREIAVRAPREAMLDPAFNFRTLL